MNNTFIVRKDDTLDCSPALVWVLGCCTMSLECCCPEHGVPEAGVSSGGAISAALRLSAEVENATIVCIICDRGDRYLSTGKSVNKLHLF